MTRAAPKDDPSAARICSETERPGRDIVVIMRMGDANAYYHIKPIAEVSWIRAVWVLRPTGAVRRRLIPKARFREIPGRNRWCRFWNLYKTAIDIGRREDVAAFMSFNAVPYGLIALLAGLRSGKPTHLGIVGSDWHRILRGPLGVVLGPLVRRADLVTVAGDRVKAEMVEHGYSPDQIACLRHVIDVDASVDTPPEDRVYDVLFVGLLVAQKRVDLILAAVAKLKAKLPAVRACIVGDGPSYSKLRSLCRRLGLFNNVEFVGFRDDPSSFFSSARTVVIASDEEGFPFALVEGICAGAVPVATDVGAIGDYITHDVDGVLVPPREPDVLANALADLLTDPVRYARLRSGGFVLRESFRMEPVTAQWSEWLVAMNTRGAISP